MTCVRLLEIIPIVYERFNPSLMEPSGNKMAVNNACGFNWLHDLMDWGKSSLKVVLTYWRRAVISLLNFFKGSCCLSASSTIRDIENLISLGEGFFPHIRKQTVLYKLPFFHTEMMFYTIHYDNVYPILSLIF